MTTNNSLHIRFLVTYPAAFTLDVDLQLPNRGIIGLFGRSGSGKTTLLRCIAGLQHTQQGKLHINGDRWQDADYFVPTHKRPLGYVFQEASLFPHLTARGNLDYARQRATPAEGGVTFDQAVSLLGIETVLNRYSEQLSGGERQRVAIARALLVNPRLLLMDEPLASLDLARKQEILPYLERLHRELSIPIIYVSHAADEIARLADYLVVLNRGRAVASGPLTEVLGRLDFPVQLGEDAGMVLEGNVEARDRQWHLTCVAFPGGKVWLRDHGHDIGEAVRLRILARDVSLALARHDDTSILNLLPAAVEEIAENGEQGVALVRIRVGESALIARVTLRSVAHLKLTPGKPVWAQVKSVALMQ